MRMAITPCEQLWTGLRFLATEKNCEDFKFWAIIAEQALGTVFSETLSKLYLY
jgi:hypothetical protein